MSFSHLVKHHASASSCSRRYVSSLLCLCAYSQASQQLCNFERLPLQLLFRRGICHTATSKGAAFAAPPILNLGWANGLRRRSSRKLDIMRCKMGSRAGGPPGELTVEDYQKNGGVPEGSIDLEKLKVTMGKIRSWLGYESYDVSLFLLDDEDMAEQNLKLLGVEGPTDIISTPMLGAIEPGLLEDPQIDFPPFYSLGDMLIDVAYVIRRCQEDQEEDPDTSHENDDGSDENNEDEEGFEYEDRGVSAGMAKVTDPELRVHMLLVHGMLHLVGHDHEKDHDYELMVNKEEELLIHLGFPTALNPSPLAKK